MKTMPLVKADAFIVNVGTPEQRQDLLKQAVLRQRTVPSISNTNEGCWRGQFKYTNDEWLLNELKQHLQTVVDYYIDADPSYRHRLTPRGLDINYWTNINNPGSNNRLHTHKDDDFSAIYYLVAENTGDLTFHNPANLLTDCSLNSPYTSRMCYTPVEGDLVIWPAWMPHEVETNTSNTQRVNIAFNIKL